jgi:hypothetical protein
MAASVWSTSTLLIVGCVVGTREYEQTVDYESVSDKDKEDVVGESTVLPFTPRGFPFEHGALPQFGILDWPPGSRAPSYVPQPLSRGRSPQRRRHSHSYRPWKRKSTASSQPSPAKTKKRHEVC